MATSRRLEQWIAGGTPLELAGHRVFTRTAITANRPGLLLIHGYPTASYDWHRLWEPLAQTYSLYALDLLGFGLSDKPAGFDYPITVQADLCQALLEHHGVGEVHVLAHDYGDTVAQELLAREREGKLSLGSVCFLNGGLFPEVHRALPVQKALALPVVGPLLGRAMNYRRFAASMRRVAGRRPPDEQDLQDLWDLIQRNDGRQALVRLIGYMAQRRRHRERWVGALVGSTVARRLICGALDPVSGAHLAEHYRLQVPQPDVVLLDAVGHYPQLEDPDRVLAEYQQFRERTSALR
jgi:pimeloyl-ACP methyl ester carboxylesterase